MLQAEGARRKEKWEEQEEMDNGGFGPSPFIAQRRPTVVLHDHR